MTQTVGLQDTERDAPFLSTIPDASGVLDDADGAPELDRTIPVLKMRGSAHVTAKRRLQIEQGGLRVEPLEGPSRR